VWPKSGQLYAAFDLLDDISREVGPDAPWECPRAEELDRVNVATWIDANFTDPDVRALMAMEVNSVVGADPTEVSMLYWAWYVAACEGVRSIRFDVNDSLWIGGSQQISLLLGEMLDEDLLLDWPVTTVRQDDAGVTVCSGDREIRAGHVVVAVPPHSAHRIRFEPMLELRRTQFQMRAPMGRMAKVQVRYAEPFWRADGLSGEYCSIVGINCIGMDVVRPDDSQATLVSFIGGHDYDRFTAMEPERRRRAFIDQMVAVYGEQAESPLFYHEMLWPQQPWQLGAPTCFVPPGAFASTGSARQRPVGRIHFAGTEAAARYPGFMEGAVRAGNVAARELTAILRG
jgi:monoamine oxidase